MDNFSQESQNNNNKNKPYVGYLRNYGLSLNLLLFTPRLFFKLKLKKKLRCKNCKICEYLWNIFQWSLVIAY
jgi:hypothetical protein